MDLVEQSGDTFDGVDDATQAPDVPQISGAGSSFPAGFITSTRLRAEWWHAAPEARVELTSRAFLA